MMSIDKIDALARIQNDMRIVIDGLTCSDPTLKLLKNKVKKSIDMIEDIKSGTGTEREDKDVITLFNEVDEVDETYDTMGQAIAQLVELKKQYTNDAKFDVIGETARSFVLYDKGTRELHTIAIVDTTEDMSKYKLGLYALVNFDDAGDMTVILNNATLSDAIIELNKFKSEKYYEDRDYITLVSTDSMHLIRQRGNDTYWQLWMIIPNRIIEHQIEPDYIDDDD